MALLITQITYQIQTRYLSFWFSCVQKLWEVPCAIALISGANGNQSVFFQYVKEIVNQKL